MKNTVHSALDAVYLACIWVAGLSILGMSLIIPVGVVTRYVFGFGAQWPEPIAILLMVVFTFIGAAAGYRAGAHIAVGMLTDRLPPALRALVARAVDILMLAVSLFMLWYGTKLSMETMGQSLAALPAVPVGLTYAPVPLGGLVTLLFVLERIVFGAQHARAVVTYDHQVEEATVVN
ncbi:MAG: TRAP transporter small permease [Burkholderiaceae bacterium]|nr:TRAP transporter small permease [Burkholderiaceae bacterium]